MPFWARELSPARIEEGMRKLPDPRRVIEQTEALRAALALVNQRPSEGDYALDKHALPKPRPDNPRQDQRARGNDWQHERDLAHEKRPAPTIAIRRIFAEAQR